MRTLPNGARGLLAVVGALLCVTSLGACTASPRATAAGHAGQSGSSSAASDPTSVPASGSSSSGGSSSGGSEGTASPSAGAPTTPVAPATTLTSTAPLSPVPSTAPTGTTAGTPSSGVRQSTGTPQPSSARVVVREANVTVGGLARHYRLVLPPGASRATPVRTLMVLHGWHDDAATLAQSSGIEQTGLASGLAVLEPDGVGMSWNAGSCCGTAASSGVDDVAALRAILAAAGADGVALTGRPYVVGFSNGGMMTYRWVCAGGPARAAAVLNGSLMVPCSGRGVPLLHVSGLSDHTVPTAGTDYSSYLGTSVMSARDSLTTATGCSSLSAVPGPATVTHSFIGCGGRARLVTVEHLGHRLYSVGGFSPGPYAVSWVLSHG